jgi:hypothetical protein
VPDVLAEVLYEGQVAAQLFIKQIPNLAQLLVDRGIQITER